MKYLSNVVEFAKRVVSAISSLIAFLLLATGVILYQLFNKIAATCSGLIGWLNLGLEITIVLSLAALVIAYFTPAVSIAPFAIWFAKASTMQALTALAQTATTLRFLTACIMATQVRVPA